MPRLLSASLVVLLVSALMPTAAFGAFPTAGSRSHTVPAGGTLTVTLLAINEGGPVTFEITSPPTHGNLGAIGAVTCGALVGATVPTVDCWAEVTYTPEAAYLGPDSFLYRALGPDAGPQTTVDITVAAANQAPTGGSDPGIAAFEDIPFTSFGSLLGDDGDPDGDSITARLLTQPEHATLSVFPDGALTIVPDADYATLNDDPDPFTYAISDGVTETGPIQASVHTLWVDDPPSFTLAGTETSVDEDTGARTVSDWVTDVRSGPANEEPFEQVRFVVTNDNPGLFSAQPAIATVTAPGAGASTDLTFTPAEDATGSATVSVTAYDTPENEPTLPEPSDYTSDTATFTITVNPAEGPAADPQSVTLDEDSVAIPITLTGSDPEDDALDFTVVTGPTHGTLSGTAPDLTYTPAANYFGPDSFTFTVDDGVTTSPPASVAIAVNGVNDPVDARSDAVRVTATTTTVLDLFKVNGGGADSAGPGEPLSQLTITAVTKPTKGTASITGNGTRVTYDPTGCSYGSDTFSYTISDGEDTDTATVVVTIARPGQHGLTTTPITDVPTLSFIGGSIEGRTMPMRLAWCGVTASSATVRSYAVQQSTNAGATWGSLIASTTAGNSTRSLAFGTSYRWKARTTDSASRTGSYRGSLVSRLARIQNTSAGVSYVGPWATTTTANASGGSQRTTTTANASATFTVTNIRTFALIGTRASSRGSFRVYVDDVLVATASAKTTSSTVLYRRVLYARNVSSGPGVSHVVRIEAVGNGRIDLDAIVTLATP